MKRFLLAVLLLLAFAGQVLAQTPTIVNRQISETTIGYTVTTYALSATTAVLNNNFAIAVVDNADVRSPSAVLDDKGNTWTVAGAAKGDTNQRLQLFFRNGITDAPRGLQANYASATNFVSMAWSEWMNVATSGALDSGGVGAGVCNGNATNQDLDCSSALNPTQAGDLMIACGTQTDTNASIAGWQAATGATLFFADRLDSLACEYKILPDTTAFTPHMFLSASHAWVIVAAIFKAASAGTAATGIHATGAYHGRLKAADTSAVALQYPCDGSENAMVVQWNGAAGATISAIAGSGITFGSASPNNAFLQAGTGVINGGSGQGQLWYAQNISCTSSSGISITDAGGNQLDTNVIIIGVAGAATATYAANIQTATGNDMTGASFNGVTVTPVTVNELVLSHIGAKTGLGSQIQSNTNCKVFSATTFPVIVTSPVDENQPSSACISSVAVQNVYGTNGLAVGEWADEGASFKAGGPVVAVGSSGYKAASASYSFSVNCSGANRYLVVAVSMLSVLGSSVTGITHNGAAMTNIGSRASVSGAIRAELWGLVAPATGAQTVAVSLSAALDSAAGANCFSNVSQTDPFEAFNSNQATNVGAADASITVTTSAASDTIIAVVATTDTAITTPVAGVEQWNTTGALGSGAGQTVGPVGATGAQALTWTAVGALATWVTAGVALIPVGEAAVPTLASINPTSGSQGSVVSVSFVGTNFDGGNVTVNVSGAGVTAGTPSSVTSTTMASAFTIAGGAATGARNVTVTTDGGTTAAQTFTVTGAATGGGGTTAGTFMLMGVAR